MEMAMNKWLTVESSERNRWVRFGKRTHREAYFGGVRLPRQLLRGISSDSVWRTNPPEGVFGVGFIGKWGRLAEKHGLAPMDMDDVDAMDGHGRSNGQRRCEGDKSNGRAAARPYQALALQKGWLRTDEWRR